MADDTTKPISQVKVGDKISNSEPDNPATETDSVTAVHVTYTDHNYEQLTIATPVGPKTVTSTAEHLYWDTTTHAWTQADNLNSGDQLDTPSNGHATIIATKHYTAIQTTYNLTVNVVHTYYVVAGDTPILVHNSSCPRFVADSKGTINDLDGPQAQILINKAAGDGFRDDLAAFFRGNGRTVVTDGENKGALTFTTPMGTRTFDLGVWDGNGNLLGYVEAKTGSSPYTAAQQAKDDWLRQQYGFNIAVVRAAG